MRHRKRNIRLGRNTPQRKALVRSLAQNLIRDQRIKTSLVKAKQARRVADNLISLGKKGTLHARRTAYRILNRRDLVKKLFSELSPLFKERSSGYTRIIPYKQRKGDNSPLVFLEFTERIKKEEKPVKKEKKGKPGETAAKPERPSEETQPRAVKKPAEKKKQKRAQEKPTKFFGGLRKFFKKERDSL